MRTSNVFGALLASALITSAIPSHAEFVADAGGEMRVIGKLQGEQTAAGLGRNVTVRDAVRQIVPSDFSVRFTPGSDSAADKRVSWKGGRPWSEVFADVIGNVPDLAAEIDVPGRLVTISPSSSGHVEPSNTPLATETSWHIRNGDKLSEALAHWGREAGWQGVFWEAPDLVSGIDVSFSGSFEDAVTQAIDSLVRHGAHLRVVFYGGNKVVRIVESK